MLDVRTHGQAEPVTVEADVRDAVAVELAHKIAWPTAMELMAYDAVRYLAFAALRRTGQVPADLTFETWDERTISVEQI